METKKVQFHLSGFGKFAGVDNNPTEIIIQALRSYLSQHPPKYKENIDLQSTNVFEVSAVGSMMSFHDLVLKNTSKETNSETVYLHFGVNEKSNTFRLEMYAWNEADFRVPDERGWKPSNQVINELYGDTDVKLPSNLPLSQIYKYLLNEEHSVVFSDDPGRFICNFLYFQSLHHTKRKENAYSLFVHVPPFSEIELKEQLRFVKDILDAICITLIK